MYPHIVKIGPATLDGMVAQEQAPAGDEQEHPERVHAYDIYLRHSDRIEIRDAVELQTIIHSLDNMVGYGGIWHDWIYGDEARYWGGMVKRARKVLWALQDIQAKEQR